MHYETLYSQAYNPNPLSTMRLWWVYKPSTSASRVTLRSCMAGLNRHMGHKTVFCRWANKDEGKETIRNWDKLSQAKLDVLSSDAAQQLKLDVICIQKNFSSARPTQAGCVLHQDQIRLDLLITNTNSNWLFSAQITAQTGWIPK